MEVGILHRRVYDSTKYERTTRVQKEFRAQDIAGIGFGHLAVSCIGTNGLGFRAEGLGWAMRVRSSGIGVDVARRNVYQNPTPKIKMHDSLHSPDLKTQELQRLRSKTY